MLIEENL